MLRKQNTLQSSVEISGRGYWTGQRVRVRIEPADAGTGIRMVRDDLPGCPECPALIEFQQEAAMRTNLQAGAARFEMVEHVLAALAGMRVDNARVLCDAMEMPGMDGSSLELTQAIAAVGTRPQSRYKETLRIRHEYRLAHRGSWLFVSPAETEESHYEYQMSFDQPGGIEPQVFGVNLDSEKFLHDVAGARTFITADQAAAIRAKGLAGHVTNADLLVLGDDGPIDNVLRFPNECSRHKTLDLIGDLALAGVDLIGRVTSFRGGHALNGRMARRLAILARRQSMLYSQDRRVIRSAA
ncbi:MAG: UDP-3-O-acyl-N-acetylglucosamine deacetylase [Planctomycetota bacterium]